MVQKAHEMKQTIIMAASIIGVCMACVLAHVALIEVGQEVAVVHEPTPTVATHETRLWIVDDGTYSWIHPGNANARWWVENMNANPIVKIDRNGETRQCRAVPDVAAHSKVHQLLRQKYGTADRWVRFLAGTDTRRGLLTSGEPCKTVPIRLEPVL